MLAQPSVEQYAFAPQLLEHYHKCNEYRLHKPKPIIDAEDIDVRFFVLWLFYNLYF